MNVNKQMLEALRRALSDFGADYKGPTIDAIRDAISFGENDAAIRARDEEQAASLKETGRCAYAALEEMVSALECDYDRLDELLSQKETALSPDEAAELKELYAATCQGECKSRDDAEQRIHEDPLSIEVRGDWCSPCDEELATPTEFRILLATGGPAVRIIGELDANQEPKSATLQTQDWFTPWTDYRDADEDTLLAYCRCFYLGE